MIQPLFEHRLNLAGYETRVLELEGDGPPIVMFHGYADSADTWRHALALLARRGRRAVAVDLPGFGTADPLLGDPILPQLDTFAAAAVRYAAGRPATPALVVGNSLGGCVSLRLAERHGSRLDGVIAVAPAGLEMSRLLHIVQRDPVLKSLLAVPAPVPGLVLRAAVARLYAQLAFATPRRVKPEVVATFTWHHRERAKVASYLDIARRLIPELRSPYELGRIDTRVLLVWGDKDRLVFHRGAERVLDVVPDSRLELLSGIGHCPQVEAPDRLTELLLEFSSGGGGGGGGGGRRRQQRRAGARGPPLRPSGGQSPAGCRTTNVLRSGSFAGRFDHRLPVCARATVSKRSPAMYMNVCPLLANTVIHLPGPGLPQLISSPEVIVVLRIPAAANTKLIEPEQS